jgi:cobalt-zinc-cadmium efflux system outer membrane protein
LWAIGLAILAGCMTSSPPAEGLLIRPLDVTASQVAEETKPPPRPESASPRAPGQPLPQRLRVPPNLPGAEVPPLQMPSRDADRPAFEKALAEMFPAAPALPADLVPTEGPVLNLTELQQQMLAVHPSLRQAAADVEAARGAALQAGLPPNPVFGFEADTVGSGRTAGQQGAKYEQLIKTAGKLRLAQASAMIDLLIAEVNLRRAQYDLITQVRGTYFAVLVAQEQLRVAHLVARLTEESYRVQVDQLRGGQAAPYEPAQLRALATQARAALSQAENRYRSAWRQLAAAVGRPDLPPARLAGSGIMAAPAFDYELIRARMLEVHTDLRNAANGVARARTQLRLAEVTPFPDVNVKVVVQKDFSAPPFATTANVEIGVPTPVWDRNQGGIQQAQGQLGRALEEARRVELNLLTNLADAIERYETNRQFVELYRNQILPDQVRAYRGVVQRYQQQPEAVNYNDIITTQQTLVTSLANYLQALAAQWQAVADLAALAQLDDLYPTVPEVKK